MPDEVMQRAHVVEDHASHRGRRQRLHIGERTTAHRLRCLSAQMQLKSRVRMVGEGQRQRVERSASWCGDRGQQDPGEQRTTCRDRLDEESQRDERQRGAGRRQRLDGHGGRQQ